MAHTMTSERAHAALLRGDALDDLTVEGDLIFHPDESDPRHACALTRLPDHLRVGKLEIRNALNLHALPKGLCCDTFILSGSPLTALPADVEVRDTLALIRCERLTSLPPRLRVRTLILSYCFALDDLPPDLMVREGLCIGHCPKIQALPSGLTLMHLDLDNCAGIRALPADLVVSYMLDLSTYSAEDVAGIGFERDYPVAIELPALPMRELAIPFLLLYGWRNLTSIPPNLQVTDVLKIRECPALESLPATLSPRILELARLPRLTALPAGLGDCKYVDCTDCRSLETLPDGMRVERLRLSNCVSLLWLPAGLCVEWLDISGCTALEEWPLLGRPSMQRLNAQGCARLRELPADLREVEELDLSGCASLHTLPEGLRVTGRLEVADSGLTGLPSSIDERVLRWNGMRLSARAVFAPETLTPEEVLAERNAEVRRVMLERMGIQRFMRLARAEVLDEDTDVGGPRQLLCVSEWNDDPLVCLSVRDPSTGRQYMLRVPPWMETCHEAAAWIAGFDDPDDYHPIAET